MTHVALLVDHALADQSFLLLEHLLHILLGLTRFTRVGNEELEDIAEFLLVFFPFLSVEDVPLVSTAAIKERDGTPVFESIWSILLFGFAS